MKKFRVVLILALCSMMFLALTACAPKIDSLKSKFEKADYKVSTIGKTLTAVKDTEGIYVTWYDSDEAADKAEETSDSIIGLAVVALKLDKKDLSVKRKGNVIAIGTKEALKKF